MSRSNIAQYGPAINRDRSTTRKSSSAPALGNPVLWSVALRSDIQAEKASNVIRSVERVKEELEEEERPDQSKIARWLIRAKEGLQLGSLGREAIDAAKDVFENFGLPWSS